MSRDRSSDGFSQTTATKVNANPTPVNIPFSICAKPSLK